MRYEDDDDELLGKGGGLVRRFVWEATESLWLGLEL
jgi:hypothetical protein